MSQGLFFLLCAALIAAIEACGPGAPRQARPIPPRPMKRDIHLISPDTTNPKSSSSTFDAEKNTIGVIKMTEDLFALFDHDTDGIVNLNEISSASEGLTKVVRTADTNGDGVVTLQEFQRIMLS